MEEENGSINGPFPNRSRPLFQSKAKWEVIDLKIIFYSNGGTRGGVRGAHPPPLIFRPHGGPKGRNFFFGGGPKFFFFWDRPPPPPPYLRVWMTAPPPPYLKVWIRHCILMQIKLIFIWKVLHLASLWKWECSESGNGQLCIEKGGKFEWFINIVPRTFHEKMGGAREPWGRECFWRTWEVQMVKEST